MAPIPSTSSGGGGRVRVDAQTASNLADKVASGEKLTAQETKQLQVVLQSPEFKDLFTASERQTLQSFVQGTNPSRPTQELVGKLEGLQKPSEVPQRFESDFTLIRDQLFERTQDSNDRANRAFEYFSKYAERFVEVAGSKQNRGLLQLSKSKDAPETKRASDQDRVALEELADSLPDLRADRLGDRRDKLTADRSQQTNANRGSKPEGPTQSGLPAPEYAQTSLGLQAQRLKFLKVLQDLGFEQIVDQRTGKDGLQLAQELLKARTPAELKNLLHSLSLTAQNFPPASGELLQNGERVAVVPPETLREVSELAVSTRALKVSQNEQAQQPRGEHELSALRAPMPDSRAWMAPVPGQPPPQKMFDWRQAAEERSRRRSSGRDGKLGSGMLWNVLHRFRAPREEESATADSAWDKIAIGAVLVLALTSVLVVALMNL